MLRRERIVVLLNHLTDVQNGLWDSRSSGGGLPIPCSVAQHPAYKQLERLLAVLRGDEPAAWKALVALYLYPSYRRRAWCSGCDRVAPPERVGQIHRHGRKLVALVPRMVRVPLYEVASADVDAGVDWLEAHWRGDPSIPAELLGVGAGA